MMLPRYRPEGAGEWHSLLSFSLRKRRAGKGNGIRENKGKRMDDTNGVDQNDTLNSQVKGGAINQSIAIPSIFRVSRELKSRNAMLQASSCPLSLLSILGVSVLLFAVL